MNNIANNWQTLAKHAILLLLAIKHYFNNLLALTPNAETTYCKAYSGKIIVIISALQLNLYLHVKTFILMLQLDFFLCGNERKNCAKLHLAR